jgi:oxaloacetate decarboxylase (Na+ extruding) subunit alpha
MTWPFRTFKFPARTIGGSSEIPSCFAGAGTEHTWAVALKIVLDKEGNHMKISPLKITETVLRDGHQSLAATRMRISDMLPVLEQLDEAGFFSLEAWGGATFDSCLRFLDEDPWERLRTLKKHVKKTPLQMLLRGQNVLGYNHYADDVVEEFVKRAVDNGIGVIRIFDALNDVRNMEVSMRAAKEAGAHVQGAFVYTISPYHSNESFLKVAEDLVALGADSICIKDMAGLLAPYVAYDLVRSLKATVNVPIHLHTHYTSGMASMTYLKAVEAGVDIVDCALSPFALGTSQPPTEGIVAALAGQERDTGIKKELLYPIADHFRGVKRQLAETFKLNTAIDIDTKVLTFQIPGGMLSNLLNQMKEQGMADKYPELIEEMPRVRADLGYPPLVTPTSQIVGSMSAFNVMLGRYKVVPREVKDLARGKYGRTPTSISDEVRSLIADDEFIVNRPADDIPPQLDALKAELADKGYPNASMEDVLSYGLFPDVFISFKNQSVR